MPRKKKSENSFNAMVKVDSAAVQRMEEIAEACSLTTLGTKGQFEKAAVLAQGIRELRELVSGPFLENLIALQNSKLGFRTDRKPGEEYPPQVIRECAIECILRGGQVIGNEFNIIAGNCYLTKEFFERKIREFRGIRNYREQVSIKSFPDGGKGTAFVNCSATWEVNGKGNSIGVDEGDKLLLPIRVNAFMGYDAIIGKAERKLRYRVYFRLTGDSSIPEGDAEDVKPADYTVVDDPKPDTDPKGPGGFTPPNAPADPAPKSNVEILKNRIKDKIGGNGKNGNGNGDFKGSTDEPEEEPEGDTEPEAPQDPQDAPQLDEPEAKPPRIEDITESLTLEVEGDIDDDRGARLKRAGFAMVDNGLYRCPGNEPINAKHGVNFLKELFHDTEVAVSVIGEETGTVVRAV